MASKENQEALTYLKNLQFDESKFVCEEADKCLDTLQQAIDEREELKNELCLHCGKYKNEHLGACKGCKWYE